MRSKQDSTSNTGLLSRMVCTLLLGVSVVTLAPAADAESDPVLAALSARHFTASVSDLEQLAGGRDALVGRLLEIHTQEQPPFAGVRATKVLLQLSEHPGVSQALESDVGSYLGLARVITANIDTVSDPAVRSKLAKVALDRADKDPGFAPAAKALLESKDAEVSRLAREKLK